MSVKHVLDFLQLKSQVLAVNTMKGYVTAISHRHILVQSTLLSLDTLIRRWIKGLEHTKGIPCMIMPAWCLELVLAALTQAPFEPIGTCHLKYPTWKTAFLLTISSGRRASEMHALCCKPLYIQFSNAGVTLFTRLGFIPKVYNKVNMSWPTLCQKCTTRQMWLYHKLCVRGALNEYVRCTSDFGHNGAAQLIVAYGRHIGKAISKQRFSKWLVECIKFAYNQNDLPTPDGPPDTQNGGYIC